MTGCNAASGWNSLMTLPPEQKPRNEWSTRCGLRLGGLWRPRGVVLFRQRAPDLPAGSNRRCRGDLGRCRSSRRRAQGPVDRMVGGAAGCAAGHFGAAALGGVGLRVSPTESVTARPGGGLIVSLHVTDPAWLRACCSGFRAVRGCSHRRAPGIPCRSRARGTRSSPPSCSASTWPELVEAQRPPCDGPRPQPVQVP